MNRLQLTSGLFAIVLAGTGSAQVTQRVSLDSSGAQGSGNSAGRSLIAGDGRYVVFSSQASDLVPGDTNASPDVFVRDRQLGTTERVSVDSNEAQSVGGAGAFSVSADGRYVAFESISSGLVPGDADTQSDVFIRDRLNGTTALVSVESGGVIETGRSDSPAISADGRWVAFVNNTDTDGGGHLMGISDDDVFVRDLQSGTTERVSISTAGVRGNNGDRWPSISGDGRFVTFESASTNLVAGDTSSSVDVYVRDRQNATTELVSVSTGGTLGDGESTDPWISADGRFVAFESVATNLVAGDTNAHPDVFVRDLQNTTTERVSVSSLGAQGTLDSRAPFVSADGRYVVFHSQAGNLVQGDLNHVYDVFVRDRQSAVTTRVSLSSSGAQVSYPSLVGSISADGDYVSFQSQSADLVPGDTNVFTDVFLRERSGGTDFITLCHPGTAGVLGCPCSNPPNADARGCDNSSATGGASVSASGGAYLSSDSLLFTTYREKPTALSIVLQGNSFIAAGTVYGQGVRCVGGTLKRLFTKSAVSGTIIAPDFGAGDPSVSARSAAMGSTISAGQSRWCLVYYRDATVLGGCPAVATFNATQTARITWAP